MLNSRIFVVHKLFERVYVATFQLRSKQIYVVPCEVCGGDDCNTRSDDEQRFRYPKLAAGICDTDSRSTLLSDDANTFVNCH